MTNIEGLIRTESDGSLSFGNYTLPKKSKVSDFEHNGDLYKVKTHKEVTKLERNDMFVYESVPGTTVLNFKDDKDIGTMKTNLGGKLTFSVYLDEGTTAKVKVEKV